jgi:proteic killer suppression protein
MIESFRHKGLRFFFEEGDLSKIQTAHSKKIRLILALLHAAASTKDLNFPGSDLHRLKGDKKEFWSVKISGNWRIIFKFKNGNAYEVDYIDYH